MEGARLLYVFAILGTVIYNMMQLTVPFFSGRIIDRFLSGEGARQYLEAHTDEFIRLLLLMIGLTILRCAIVYLDCMAYEKVSQTVLFRVRNFLYDKIQRQDM
jgi:ATP-binding cassette subfamily B protein